MKLLLTSAMTFLFALFSMNALADKITIQGEPIVIKKQGEVYLLPEGTTVSPSENYYYFTVGDTKRVCYKEVNPTIKSAYEDYPVRFGNDVVSLHCYTYSPEYFVTQ